MPKRIRMERPDDANRELKRFGELLKRYRLAAGWSREELAEHARLSARTVGALEQGSRQKPYRDTIAALAGALALPAEACVELERAAFRRPSPVAQTTHVELAQNNLPLQLTSFVDRVEVVAEIKELLQSHRLVTLVGTGGCGKSRCAIRVAADMLDIPDGVWLAELAPITDPTLVGSVIARTFSLQQPETGAMLDTVLTYLKHRRLLLVLDNCEHVIDEARIVVTVILRGCPQVRFLATSRESLTIAGEHAYRMPSLSVPFRCENLSTKDLSCYGAVQLFNDRAVSADNSFTFSDESGPYVAEICRQLDGIPLAIELAAARVKVLSPKQLAQKLDERFRLLTAGDRAALPRHRTMRALIDWSYDLLTEDERRVFRRLSIFAGDFTLELAGAVCSDETIDDIAMLDRISSLVDKSLVQTEQPENTTRYHLLETMRQYARERLTEAGEYDTVARAHATAFLRRAEELDRDWETMPEGELSAQAERDFANFVVALRWALLLGNDVRLGQQLVGKLFRNWRWIAPAEGRRWVRIARNLIDAETPAQVVAAVDLTEAWLAATLGQHTISRMLAEQAIARYGKTADSMDIARAYFVLGDELVFASEIEQAETVLAQARERARTLGAHKLEGFTLHSLARARAWTGDLTGARVLFDEALGIFRAIGAEHAAAVAGTSFAEAEFRAGDRAAALDRTRAAIDAFRTLKDTRTVAWPLHKRSAYLIALGRYDEAYTFSRAALAAARDAQFQVFVVWTLQHLAAIAVLRPTSEIAHERVDRLRAARLLGYVDARLAGFEIPRDYTERQEYDRMLAALRDALGEDKVAKLTNEGNTWSEDQALAEAMLI